MKVEIPDALVNQALAAVGLTVFDVTQHEDARLRRVDEYARHWTSLIIAKREADLWKYVEHPLDYYVYDGLRRVLADLGITDPLEFKERKNK